MGKKLTIEFVKESFEKKNHELLTKNYINSKQKLDYICPKGHRGSITWGHWQRGQGCPICFEETKLKIGFVREEFLKKWYILLTTEYVNNSQKLDYICPKGHKHSITWSDWQQGGGCPYCSNKAKLTIDFICEEFKKEEYTLLTKVYINNKQKLEYICPEGHKCSIRWDNWKQGQRCPTCAILKRRGSGNPSWKGGISKEPYCQDWSKDLKEFIKERDGYQCLNPDCWHKDNMLSVHHINYQKKVCGSENLITVCRSCNGRANKDRNWHKAWYRAILHKRYNYIYF